MNERPTPPDQAWDRAKTMRNLVSTMLNHGNTLHELRAAGIERIAFHQGCRAADLTEEFERQEHARSLTPKNYEEMDK